MQRGAAFSCINFIDGETPMKNEQQSAPAFSKQLGNIRVAVWRNEVNGRTYYNTTLTRQYRDKDEQFQESNSFNGQADLVLVQSAASQAAEWIDAQERATAIEA
jgi:hypothetical protein